MLPDYPEVKRLLKTHCDRYFHAAINARLGPFSQVPTKILHEGEENVIHRADGSEITVEMNRTEFSGILPVTPDNLHLFGFAELHAFWDDMADKFAADRQKAFFNTIDESIREVGNVVERREDFVEQLFASLEQLWMECDSDGQLILPSFFGGTAATQNLRDAEDRIRSDPLLLARYNEILRRKKAEWNDREASRNLVD